MSCVICFRIVHVVCCLLMLLMVILVCDCRLCVVFFVVCFVFVLLCFFLWRVCFLVVVCCRLPVVVCWFPVGVSVSFSVSMVVVGLSLFVGCPWLVIDS